MKRILSILLLSLIIISCNNDSDDIVTESISEASLAKIAQLRYDTNGVFQSVDSIRIVSNQYTASKIYDANMNLIETVEWLYNSRGFLSDVNYFDANGVLIPEKTYSIEYDTNDRISSIWKNGLLREFIYSSGLVTETIFHTNSQPNTVNTYTLDNQNRIVQVDGSQFHIPKNVSVLYTGDNIVSASTTFTTTGVQTQMNSDYSFATSVSNDHSINKIFARLLGSYNNATLHDGVLAFEAKAPAYYDLRLLEEINYSGDLNRVDRFDNIFNSDDLLIETSIFSDDVLRIKLTYTYED